jgi:hypothetical protein
MPEKTVADCFKFRNKIGLDVAIEALKLCRERKGSTPRKLLPYARACRVERVMRPYLEALGGESHEEAQPDQTCPSPKKSAAGNNLVGQGHIY